MKTILFLGLDPPSCKNNEQIIHYPVIRIVPKPFSLPDHLSSFDYLIFTSKTAVDLFPVERITIPCIAVGTATTQRLQQRGIHNILTATNETAEGVVTLIDTLHLPSHTRFLWPHSALARRVIPEALNARQHDLTEYILYDTALVTPLPKPNLDTIDEIHFTSPSTIDGFLLAYHSIPLDKCIRTIGPVTAAKLKTVAEIDFSN